ncbi:MAG: methylenetetrahydrofolate--tRNA-(uracil(54)-C(5)) -methyltransferase (FADH(2)-oxidizing) TrmFO [Deltaproteobacteria bacterium]
MPSPRVIIVGAGLAGSEAALSLSAFGATVELFEMRPALSSPAHATGWMAELVCSNSLGAESEETGKGLLKAELRLFGSNLLRLAERARVPAGKALAVDRERFARAVTEAVESRGNILVHRREVPAVPDGPLVLIACGPLPSESLSRDLAERLGGEGLYFYDAISPIVETASLDLRKGFVADRYGVGSGDYWNFPMTKAEYETFRNALLEARTVPTREFEEERHFEACMPVESIAARGPDTLLFGPLRPVGLTDPNTGNRPYAVVQLRKENREGTACNLVGFQTKLAYPEQRRVFSLIPGFSRVRFLRYGSVHRNSFLDASRHLRPTMESRTRRGLFFAGQFTGVEGYVESIASGMVAAVSIAARAAGREPEVFPEETMTGALMRRITEPREGIPQPMNANFGLLPPPGRGRRRERKAGQAARALSTAGAFRTRVFEYNPLCVT